MGVVEVIKHIHMRNQEIAMLDKDGILHLFIQNEPSWWAFIKSSDEIVACMKADGAIWGLGDNSDMPFPMNGIKAIPITACNGDLLLWCDIWELPVKIAGGFKKFDRWTSWRK